MAIVVRLQHHHIHLILNLQNENKNKMLNRLSFLSENDDPQKYKGYDREGKHKSSNEPVPDSNRCRLCVCGRRK